MAANQQETYVRARDDPYFEGMRRGEAATVIKGRNVTSNVKLQGGIGRTASDISSRRSRKIIGQLLENPLYNLPPETSAATVADTSYGNAPSARWSKIPETSLSPLSDTQSALKFEVKDLNHSHKESSPCRENEERNTLICFTKPALEKSYSINEGRTNLSNVLLPPSAATFYNGHSPLMEVVESCESIYRLNMYLKDKKDDISAGVPGKFLHAVIGPDICDVGSVASTIMYAFYLSEWGKNTQFCTVPVINMNRSDINSRAELKWLFDSCLIDHSSLVFLDEIDLSYYEIFGSLKLVLSNCNQLSAKQEALKESLVEIFSCGQHGNTNTYPWVENITMAEEASCCTVIAEKFLLTAPEILSGQGFSRLLLSGILLDTGNLGDSQTTSKDKYMATLLINGAGRYGCNGLYQLLRYMMYDKCDLKVGDILQKDFKKLTRVGKIDGGNSRITVSNFGMSSIGLPIVHLLSLDSTSSTEITHFQRMEKLSVLAIVSGYFDTEKNFKREILFSAESSELRKLILFIKSSATDLPLKVLHHPGLKGEMKAFEITKLKHYGHKNPLHIAAMLGHVRFVEAILRYDSSYQMCLARDEDGRNPCHLAAMYGRLGVLEVFIRPELIQAALEKSDGGGNILHLCVKYNQLGSLKLLLSKLKDARFVNAKNDDGCTILHMSTYSHKKQIIEYLLDITKEGVVQMHVKNEDGETALDLLLRRKVDANDEMYLETLKSFQKAKALKGNAVIDWDAKREEWYEQSKQTVMLVASLIAGMAFAFGVNPPGGTVLVNVGEGSNAPKVIKPVYLSTLSSNLRRDDRTERYLFCFVVRR
ncbi:OLC1v1024125C1 [Oldenlandia corymbosa var. corymbosa]|uniref:OLC1v1024125C1 n=1 Tax=Oldenlandia corymbosa var. corymbosa TaxID=529605 RepID=A0AAV1C528_OLDCO|nr:OLC1v1024125C1 [Oldenlandia corymbosa var. corymbosa]